MQPCVMMAVIFLTLSRSICSHCLLLFACEDGKNTRVRQMLKPLLFSDTQKRTGLGGFVLFHPIGFLLCSKPSLFLFICRHGVCISFCWSVSHLRQALHICLLTYLYPSLFEDRDCLSFLSRYLPQCMAHLWCSISIW